MFMKEINDHSLNQVPEGNRHEVEMDEKLSGPMMTLSAQSQGERACSLPSADDWPARIWT